jgi:tetratricopeptide (TPR) repeat protein
MMVTRLLAAALLALALGGASLAAPAAPERWQASYDAEARGDLRASLEALEGLEGEVREGYLFHLRRGWLRYLLGAYEDAIADYQAAAALAPEALEPLQGLMLPQLGQRRWLDALETAEAALALSGEDYLALSRKAWCLYNLGRYAEAEGAYRAALRRYPSDQEMAAGLGWSLQLQGRSQEAAAVFEGILAVAPRHESARAGLEATGR